MTIIIKFKRLFQLALISIISVISFSAFAAEPINTLTDSSLFARKTGIAILGYDTVAYFTEGKPVKGSDEFTTDWKGAKWKFSKKEHLDMFLAAPEKYAPQYGGYCAYGVAQKYLVKIQAKQFTVRDGKLYLNYDAGVQKDWLKDPEGYIKKADELFAGLLKE